MSGKIQLKGGAAKQPATQRRVEVGANVAKIPAPHPHTTKKVTAALHLAPAGTSSGLPAEAPSGGVCQGLSAVIGCDDPIFTGEGGHPAQVTLA